jgi:hypothetical protein
MSHEHDEVGAIYTQARVHKQRQKSQAKAMGQMSPHKTQANGTTQN